MNHRSVLIVHPEKMVAEGIAAGLSNFAGIAPALAVTSLQEAERAEGVHAVALDRSLLGARDAALRLRRRGLRVVFLGEGPEDEYGVCISTRMSVGALAEALVPGCGTGYAEQLPSLTRREREILSLVSKGLVGKQVAKQLGISPKTVEQHKTRIFAKLGVSNQTAAACLVTAAGFRTGHAVLIHGS